MKLFLDNAFVINLTKHPMLYRRSEHIEIIFHFKREQVNLEKKNTCIIM